MTCIGLDSSAQGDKIMKVLNSLFFCLVAFSLGFCGQDSCSSQASFAKLYATHDISLETWRMRSLLSGIFLPVVGPFTVGVFAANTKVDVPSNDITDHNGQCFSSAYSGQVKSNRVAEVAKGGAIGTGMGILLYFFVLIAIVSASGGWGIHVE
jgi:hypothetical protein